MKGSEFLKRLQIYATARGLEVTLDRQRGKGSHATLYLDRNRTTLKDRRKELSIGLLHGMLKDLGIDPKDF